MDLTGDVLERRRSAAAVAVGGQVDRDAVTEPSSRSMIGRQCGGRRSGRAGRRPATPSRRRRRPARSPGPSPLPSRHLPSFQGIVNVVTSFRYSVKRWVGRGTRRRHRRRATRRSGTTRAADGLEALTVRARRRRGRNDDARRLHACSGPRKGWSAHSASGRSRSSATGWPRFQRPTIRPATSSRGRAHLPPLRARPPRALRDRVPAAAAAADQRGLQARRQQGAPDPQGTNRAAQGRRTARRPAGMAVLSEFDALCEGLAAVELRGVLRLHPPASSPVDETADLVRAEADGEAAGGAIEEHIWRDALTALLRGFAVSHAGRVPTKERRDSNPRAPA